MKQREAEELLSCLPEGRTLFTYGKDWYAISLLQMGLRQASLQDIRNSALGKLLSKPKVRSWLGMFGNQSFTASDLDLLYPDEAETYRLTLGLFDGWTQTSRKGSQRWNIVLQLNLNESDARLMERKFPERWNDPFENCYHPISDGRHRTLAWARMDLDLEAGEALIEEIQNDRLREVREVVDSIRKNDMREVRLGRQSVPADFVLRYWDERLRLSRQCWDEAMLSASVDFIVRELGVRRIFYHSPVSGVLLKGSGVKKAPLSLYTDLPRRFCFQPSSKLPSFLRKRGKRFRQMWMHQLVL